MAGRAQVYLTPAERAELDRQALAQGVSRSEVLRRGIQAVGRPGLPGALGPLAESGCLTPAPNGTGAPPRGAPVARLAELLAELDQDRADR